MLVHEEEKWFSLHKLEALTKTFQHSKQWQPTSIGSALSLESVRTVNRYEVHKRPKTTVVFFSRATFFNGRVSVMYF